MNMKKTCLTIISFTMLFTSAMVHAQHNSFLSLNSQHAKTHSFSLLDAKSSLLRTHAYPFTRALHENSLSIQPNILTLGSPSINTHLMQVQNNDQTLFSNRRLKYSSLWAFVSLNYLYADLVGLMDVNYLTQYQTGIVNGIEITPGFLTAAAAYMQLPLSNVFLPHVIKNDRTLRWVQIISGSIATLVQGATLFVGNPSPYYVLFSAIEMGATAYITIDALKWKIGKNRKKRR